MYNILEHKQEIAKNIQKAFGNTSEEIEKAKWQIGEIRVDSRGIAHECYEYTADGKPRLRRVKKNKGASNTSTDDNKLKKKVDTQITDDKEVASVDNDEYKKQYDIVLKQLMSGSDKDKHAVNFGISTVRSNISNTKKELKELKETRPGAKKAIQKLESDLVKFYSQEKAFNDALKTAISTKKEENEEGSKSVKLSAFLDKTLDAIKHYRNFDYDRIKNAEKVLTENESLAKKFMSATFPAASESALSPSEKEISISDDESIILSAYKTTDTTSRDPQYRGSTNYYYSVHYKVGNSKKLLSSDLYSRVFSSKYGGTSSDIKNKCKINALVKYFHI